MNNLATTEKEIVNMGLQIAGTGTQVGMTEAQIMAIAGALSSVGIKAERGGTAISKLLVNMSLATQKGGKALQDFAKVSGMSADEFKKAFEKDAAGAFVSFIDGLAKAKDEGKNVIQILDDMGIKEVRLRDTILRAVGANNVLSKSLKRSGQAWEENIALTKRAEERYKTAESQLKMMKNRIVDAGIEISAKLSPAILEVVEMVVRLTESFSKIPIAVQGGIFKFFALTTVIGGALSIGGRFLRGLSDTGRFLGELSKVFGGTIKMTDAAGKSVSGLSMLLQGLMGKTGLITAGVVAAIALSAKAINKHVEETKRKKKEMDKLVEDLPKTREKDKSDIQYMQDIQSEFEYLNSLVGENGDLSAMSADQQKRYLGIVKKLKEISPELETFYNSQGQLVAETTAKIEELIKVKKEEMRLDAQKTHEGFGNRLKEHAKDAEKAAEKEKELQDELKMRRDRLEKGYDTRVNISTRKEEKHYLDDEDIKKTKEEIRKLDADLKKLDSEARERVTETMRYVNAELFLIGDSFDALSPQIEHFKSAFKEMIETDPSEKGLQNVETAILELGNISEQIQNAKDKGFKIDDAEIQGYITRLTELGMGYDKASQGIFGVMTSVESGEQAFNTINKAMEEFNKNGKLSPETATALKNNFKQVEEGATDVDLALLRNIAATDKWAAAFMASQIEVDNGITSFVDKNKKQLEKLKPIDIVKPDKIIEQMGIVEQSRIEMTDKINQEAEEQKEIINYLYDELGVISKEQADKEIEDIERVRKKRLEDTEFAFNEQSKKIIEMGSDIRENLEQAIMEAEKGTMSIEQIWNNLDPETKEFIIKTTGFNEADEDFHNLLENWLLNDPEPKDFIVTCEGLEYILDNIDELGKDWDKLKPEEKIFVAKMLGYGLKDAEDFQEKWDKLDPKVKKFIAKAAGYEDVNKADEETMKKWADDPKIRMFIASHGGLDNVRIEQDKTDGQWKIKIGDRVYTSNEKGAKEARDEFNKTKDDWDKIPNKSVKEFITEKITNIRTKFFGPQGRKPGKEGRWTGDKNFKGGLTYLAEKGRELLIYPDESYDITGDTTELRNLPKGTRIYNNKDTEDILSGKKIPKFAKGNTKAKKKKTSSTKDDYKAEYDRYLPFDIALKDINRELEYNKWLQSDLEPDMKKALAIEKQNKLYKDQQNELHKTNEARRRELKALEEELALNDIVFEGKGDHKMMAYPNDMAFLPSELQSKVQQYYDIQKDIIQASKDWWTLEKNIDKSLSGIFQRRIRLEQREIELNKERQKKLHSINQERRREVKELERYLSKQGFRFTGQGDSRMITNLNNIKGKTKEVEEAFNKYIELQIERIPEASKEWQDLHLKIKDIEETMENTLKDKTEQLIEMEKKNAYMDLEYRQRIANEKLEQAKKEMEKEVENKQDKIDGLQDEIDKIQESERTRAEDLERKKKLETITNLQNKQYYLQNDLLGKITEEQAKSVGLESEREQFLERQAELQELLQRLENIRQEKNIQQLTKRADGTWDFEYVADQREISNLNKQIEDLQHNHNKTITKLKETTLEELKKAQEDYDEWERQNDIRREIEEKQNRIKKYQDEIKDLQDKYTEKERVTNEAFQTERENLDRHYMDIDRLTDEKMKDLKETFNSNWTDISEVLISYFGSIANEYDRLVDKLSTPLPTPSYDTESQGFYETSSSNVNFAGNKGMTENWSDIYMNAREKGDWRTMEYANRQANIERGLGSVVTSKEDIRIIKRKYGYARGGESRRTGWHWLDGEEGKPERVLTPQQTKDFNKLVEELPDLANIFNKGKLDKVLKSAILSNINLVNPKMPKTTLTSGNDRSIRQNVNVGKLEFPNVKDAKEIEGAIKSLSTYANQWANRK